jgi:hypothetical protein
VNVAERFGAWSLWARSGGPATAALLVIVAVTSGCGAEKVEMSASGVEQTTTTEHVASTAVTTTTTAASTSTTAAPTTTLAPSTTLAPTTTLPAPTTTAAPPTTAAPAPAGNCHPSYDPCVPYASDVDCAGGTGNGPAYTGPVRVIGPDEYDLDRDGDGFACDSS